MKYLLTSNNSKPEKEVKVSTKLVSTFEMTTEEPVVDFDGGETKGHPPKSSPEGQNAMKLLTDNASKILPAIMAAIDAAEKGYQIVSPYVQKGVDIYNQVYKQLEPYGPEEIMTCVTGVTLIFFGGSFANSTAVYEAIVQGGAANFKKTITLLHSEYTKFKIENKEDDVKDEDGDGIADVEQISGSQYVTRKTLLFLKATNPEAISNALQQLYVLFIAVLATLRLRFARTISLGASIGDQLTQLYEKFVQPNLEQVVDQNYHKWLGPAGNYFSRFVGVMVAFRIQIILTTVHTSVKGGRLLSLGLTKLAEKNGHGYLTEGYLDEALSAILAVMGIIIQLFMWTSVPIAIRLLLFPLFFVEGLLSIFVSIGMSMTSPTPA